MRLSLLSLTLFFGVLPACLDGIPGDTPKWNDTEETGEDTGIDLDFDDDGVLDTDDNCPNAANEDQADLDEDGLGDVCDEDADGDLYSTDQGDCDDANAAVSPDADELCGDSIDNDCNGAVDEDDASDAGAWFPDIDGDGFGDADAGTTACDQPAGLIADGLDCDDSDLAINPDADEVCDAVDNNCDGDVDEDGAVDGTTWYADADGDLYGDSNSSLVACAQPSGYVNNPVDCDDADANLTNGLLWYADGDGDGYGDPDSASTFACTGATGEVGNSTDCDDADAAISPGATELCDGIDNNCDGAINCDDFDCAGVDVDTDGDGVTDETCPDWSCITAGSDGYVGNATGSGLTQSYDFDGDGDHTVDTNLGETDDFLVTTPLIGFSCGVTGGTDVAFMWEAPTDGCYQFDTNGSTYDTVLRLYDECGGVEQDCDDDGGASTQSLLETSVASGERVVVVVDGFSSTSTGNYELNITAAASSGFSEDLDLGTVSGDAVATDDNTGMGDTVEGICTFGGTGEDIVYRWEAPSTDCWIFDSEGSSIDTYITLIDASNLCYEQTVCDTASAADGTNARIELSVDSGESFFVVLDAEYAGDLGPTQLNINPMGFTFDVDLGTSTGNAVSTDSNIGAGDSLTPSCEISTGEELVYRWEAPSDGCWTIDTVGSTIANSFAIGTITVDTAGWAIGDTLTIDGIALTGIAGTRTSGSDDFSVDPLTEDDQAAEIADALNDSLNSFATLISASNTLNSVNLTAVTAGSAGNTITLASLVTPPGTVTLSGVSLSGGADLDTTLMLMDNSTACPVEDDCDASNGSDGISGAVSIQALGGTEYYVVVDAASSSEQGDVQMNVSSGSSLPTDGDLASDLGPAISSGTLSAADGSDLSATCGSSSNNADLVYSWTAPAAATFDFSLENSGYDTVISLHDGCSGTEHTCNDDFHGLQSQTSLAMTSGEEVLIRVSGYSSSTGTYTLGIYADSEVVCDDGVDEDLDGLTDCADTDCASDAACGGSTGN